MDKINSLTFYQAWLGTMQDRKEHLLKIWRKATEFTSHIRSDDNSVMIEVAKKLDLLCYPYDYYSIDTILYKKEDLVPGLNPGQFWFRDIRVAFEHENNFNSGLYKEISHLLIMNCDLRVLVTYPNDDGQAGLKYLHEIIKGNRQSKVISDEESFLIIFGGETGFVWEGYVYKEDNWKIID